MCRDSRGLQSLISVRCIPLSLWRLSESRGQLQSDVGHLFPHLLGFSWRACMRARVILIEEGRAWRERVKAYARVCAANGVIGAIGGLERQGVVVIEGKRLLVTGLC